MFWQMKARLLCNNANRADQLQAGITNFLADKNTSYLFVSKNTPTELAVDVHFAVKADADAVWAQVQDARTQGWVIEPSFVAYGQQDPSDEATAQRTEWYA